MPLQMTVQPSISRGHSGGYSPKRHGELYLQQYPLLMDGRTVICKGIGVYHFVQPVSSACM